MATAAVSSHGTLLKIGDGGGSEVFTTIGEVGAPIYSSQKDLGHDEGVEVKSETNCETYVTHLDGIGIIKNN